MTAHGLIESIFSRWQDGPGNVRRITRAQLDYLRGLIDADEEGGAVTRGSPGSLVWMPMGRWKYVLTEDLRGEKHTLVKLGNVVASGTGSLF